MDDGGVSADLSTPPDLSPPPPDCTGKSMPMLGTQNRTISIGTSKRTYVLHVPPGYDPSKFTSVVFAFHGFTTLATDFTKDINVEQGSGVIPSWNAGSCCGEAQTFNTDDVGFVRTLLTSLRAEFCVDNKRVFAMGHSNGGYMVNRLACELADDFAAIGPNSAGLMFSPCTSTRPVPVYYMHVDNDSVVWYGGGFPIGWNGAKNTFDGWGTRNSCATPAKVTSQAGKVTCQTYAPCTGGADVNLCTISGGTHVWPSSNSDTQRYADGTKSYLDFFASHPKP
jgi:polyhydroxybutyrate depolymerase